MPSVNDRREMDDEPSVGAKSGRDACEGTAPGVEDAVPDTVEEPNNEGLGTMEEPSVKDTLDDTAVEDDLLKTSDANTSNGMFTDIPRVEDLESTTKEARDGVDEGYTETLNKDFEVLVPSPEAQKSKKRKLRKMTQRAAEAQDTLEKEVEENAPGEEEVVVPPVVHTSVDDAWLPEQEPLHVNDQDEDSDDEDMATDIDNDRRNMVFGHDKLTTEAAGGQLPDKNSRVASQLDGSFVYVPT
ncbi:hypothetical protein LIER_20593 [Lithospermum erythrorhizon]|uniref:Uncharacterized protein n=1 Tax=Lithospermum erythrorhizon TaxID=34254 RepID=A0AAV3QR54_LITER